MNRLRFFLPLLLLMALVFPAAVVQAKGDPTSFKGMAWGSFLTDLQQTKSLTLTKDGGKTGTSLYALGNEDMHYGKAALTGIHCSFTKERLQAVILLFSGAQNFAAMKTTAMAQFGTTTKLEQGGEEMYNWDGTVTNTVLSYNRKTQSGFLFIKAKKLPPAVKSAAKPATPPKTSQTAAASTKTTPATPPTTAASGMDTALDQAPPPSTADEPPSGAEPPEQTSQAAMYSGINPEAQALIYRDQALTQLCWETTGPAADAACVQMRENMEQLKAMGYCVQAGVQAPPGAEVAWGPCKQTGAAPAAASAATGYAAPQGAGSGQRSAASQGYASNQGYGNSQGYGNTQRYDQNQGYSNNQGYGNGQGYDTAQGSGNAQRYDQNQGYGNSQANTGGQGYGNTQEYGGTNQGYANAQGYGNAQRYGTPGTDTDQGSGYAIAPAPGQNSGGWQQNQAGPSATVPMVQGGAGAPGMAGQAQTGMDSTRRCRLIADLFVTAARMRDTGVEPQDVEKELQAQANRQLPDLGIERIRETVELVFFDQAYNQLQGDWLLQQVNDRCLRGNGPYSNLSP